MAREGRPSMKLADSYVSNVDTSEDGFSHAGRVLRGAPDWDYLKAVRLDAAHRELAAAHPSEDSVTDIALRHGFNHLGRFSIETLLVDERLTTREAYQRALENDRRKSKTEIDCMAAALIIESWLAERDRNSN